MAKACRGCIIKMSSVFGCKRESDEDTEECVAVTQFSEEELTRTSAQDRQDGVEQPLFSAIANKNFEEFRSVISECETRDASEIRDEDGYTALHRIISTCDEWDCSVEIVKLLLQLKVDPNIPTKDSLERTPLHLLVGTETFTTRRESILEDLLNQSGINVNSYDKYKNSPLKLAAEKGHLQVAETLISHEADVNKSDNGDNIPLYSATKKENVEMVKLLLEKGADSTHQNKESETALHVAIESKNPEIVKVLLKYGSKESLLKKNKDGETPYEVAERMKEFYGSKNVKNILEMLKNPEAVKYLSDSECDLVHRFQCYAVIPKNSDGTGTTINHFNIRMEGSIAAIGPDATANIETCDSQRMLIYPPLQSRDDEDDSAEQLSDFTDFWQDQRQKGNRPANKINIVNKGGTVILGDNTSATVVSPEREKEEKESYGRNASVPDEAKGPDDHKDSDSQVPRPGIARVKLKR